MTIDDNPFERWGLDPGGDGRKLTDQMRRLSTALDDDERDALQQDWRQLTSDPVARARWIALTPVATVEIEDPWEVAAELTRRPPTGRPQKLTPTLEDALVLPRMDDDALYGEPPFLPTLLADEPVRLHGDDDDEDRR